MKPASILQEVLLEEYDRCLSAIRSWKVALKDPAFKHLYPSYRKSLRSARKDLWMLRRALGLKLLFYRNKLKHRPLSQVSAKEYSISHREEASI